MRFVSSKLNLSYVLPASTFLYVGHIDIQETNFIIFCMKIRKVLFYYHIQYRGYMDCVMLFERMLQDISFSLFHIHI